MYDENKYDEHGNLIDDAETVEVLEEEGTAAAEESAADMSVSAEATLDSQNLHDSQNSTYGQTQNRQTYGQYPYGQNGSGSPSSSNYQSGSGSPSSSNYQNGSSNPVSQNYTNSPSNPNGQNYSNGHNYQNAQGGSNYQNGQRYQNNQSYGGYQNNQSNPNMNQNRQPYNPYQYNYYQNPNQNSNANRSQTTGNGAGKPPKKGGFFKKMIMLTAGALFFGALSGATMFGVNRAANILFPQETQTSIQQETQVSDIHNVPTLPAPQETQAAATGVVIEDVSPIVEAAMPSVVAINNTTLYQSQTWFGQTQTYEIPSSGSGIIVGQNETELLIVTNYHVIEGADSMTVTFIDESTVDAAVKGTDSESDLAVIAVPLDKIAADTKAQIKTATIGDSDTLKMGQGVIAIGNALGHGQSVTVGHVSALDREVTVDGVTRTVIQTDAAINPGNSGGALLNAKGELIGINEAKYADETVEGVGYAIPISYAMDIIEDLKLRTTKIELEESEQGYLGIQVQNVDAATAQMLGMPQGVYIYKIMEDSAAANSDLREKDIITKFDGETIKNNADLTGLLAYYKAGSTVTITVQSLENGAYVERQVEVVLKNRPVEEQASVKG